MDFGPLIDQKRTRFHELEKQIESSSLFENPKRARELLREHSGLKSLLEDWDRLEKSIRELEENRVMAAGADAEFAELAQAEIPLLEDRVEKLSRSVQYALLPPEPHEDRDAIMEIRAGTGGNEAGLFAADLYRMYSRYAEAHGFKIEELEGSGSELGADCGGARLPQYRFHDDFHRTDRGLDQHSRPPAADGAAVPRGIALPLAASLVSIAALPFSRHRPPQADGAAPARLAIPPYGAPQLCPSGA